VSARPAIGRRITAATSQMLATGNWAQVQRLPGAPNVDTLDALLEVTPHDGRLEQAPQVAHCTCRRFFELPAFLGSVSSSTPFSYLACASASLTGQASVKLRLA